MYFKLAFRNVKRSISDFLIYFLTLTFAVCIFYSFNSISAQQAMFDVSEAKSNTIDGLIQLLSYVSVFVSVVLGFLIIYANNFLIKRRKKELGLYMTLGMSKYKISRILVTETLFVGLLSLAVGLGLGIIASQGLSILTAKMFEVDVKKYEFVISTEAIGKTALYFGIIYLLVMLFNTFTITRYKLIDLLTASRKNESLKIRKTWVSVLLFIVSIVLLGFAYRIVLENGLFAQDNSLLISIILGVAGTFLFFMSLSGFALNILKRNKKIYYSNINMFVLRQINSKVNTTFLSMSVICIMLFFTIGVLSTGFSIKNSMESGLEAANPFDASVYTFAASEDQSAVDVNKVLKEYKIDTTKYDQAYSVNLYNTKVEQNALLKKHQDESAEKLTKNAPSMPLAAIKQSDYKKLANMQGEKTVNIPKDSVWIFYNMENFRKTNENLIENQKTLNIQGKDYKIINSKAEKFSYTNTFNPSDAIVVVLPDEAVKGMSVYESIWNVNYKQNVVAKDKEIMDKMGSLSYGPEAQKRGYPIYALTKSYSYDAAVGNSTIFVFLGIYLGAIFLIASTAVLALQQLSEASDNITRYSMLKKIGVPMKVSNRAIFKQIGIYFLMPLTLAIVHSFFGIKVVNEAVMLFGETSVFIPSLITGAFLILVYGGYFFATYVGYKNIVK
ncbi:FtsX-like permease family protein [Bacillus massiliigorillae]|uniref:FtsX-like permease family protein n=1 Tax=Bacillus massiliigorillae TaxID=1243664 RepID=UPI00039D1869|nr:ABC transporter permease [Bacillus massiliigorillae]